MPSVGFGMCRWCQNMVGVKDGKFLHHGNFAGNVIPGVFYSFIVNRSNSIELCLGSNLQPDKVLGDNEYNED